VTQPSVSSAIASLGRELGCDLFERAGRGIQPTAAGAAFAPYAEDVVGLLRSGREAAREAAEVAAQRMQIAAVTTAAESFVPGLMRSFSERHPEVELTLVVGNNEDVLNRVLTHQDDVAIAGQPPGGERLAAEPIMENAIVCITRPDDAATGETVEAAALADRSWLLRESGSGTRALNERFLSERGIAPRTLTLGSNGAIKQAARAGLGVSLMSRAAVATELESGWLGEILLSDGPPTRQWFVLRSAVGPVRPAVELFIAFLRDAVPLIAAR
jgi:DNA-binding transcriptional LysR family regulator